MDLLLIIVPLILVWASQMYINSSYQKYSTHDIKSKMTGKDVTEKILESHNLNKKIKIKKVSGTLTDNFNPKTNVVSLSNDIYSSSSIASVAVAAHECGHVLQHDEKYLFIMIRSFLVPIVNFSSKFGYIIIVVGWLLSLFDLILLGILLMSVALIFQLITLPTEFNASKRAAVELVKLNVITQKELKEVKKMLRSAAYTYVASFFANLAQLLRYLLILRRNDD